MIVSEVLHIWRLLALFQTEICWTKLRKHLIVLATGRFCYSKVEVLHHLDVLDNFFDGDQKACLFDVQDGR